MRKWYPLNSSFRVTIALGAYPCYSSVQHFSVFSHNQVDDLLCNQQCVQSHEIYSHYHFQQTGTLPKIGTGGVTAVSLARNLTGASSIVVNTAGGVPGTSFANINKRISQTAVVGQTGTTVSATLTPTVRVRTAGAMTVQDITANQAQLQARAALQTSSATVITTTMTAAQLAAQRMPVSTVASSAIKTVSQRSKSIPVICTASYKMCIELGLRYCHFKISVSSLRNKSGFASVPVTCCCPCC